MLLLAERLEHRQRALLADLIALLFRQLATMNVAGVSRHAGAVVELTKGTATFMARHLDAGRMRYSRCRIGKPIPTI